MTIFLITEDNNAPAFTVALERDGVAIDLSGCSVALIIKNDHSGVITNAGGACTIGSPSTAGSITYTPLATDFPSEGRYVCDVRITYVNSSIERLPEQIVVVARSKIV